MRLDQIIKRPILTEKVNFQKMDHNKITFEVAVGANKPEIRKAIETLFDVKVLSVNTQKYIGKKKRVGRQEFQQAAWKKAIVQLSEDSSIEFIEGV